METIIKKLALYVTIAAVCALTALALIPTANATSMANAEAIETGLRNQCLTVFRSGTTEFIGTTCEEYSLIAINTERKLSLMFEPSNEVIEGFKKLSSIGLLSRYDETTKILAVDSSKLDIEAVEKFFNDALLAESGEFK
jgi:hypothetical protein